MLRADRHGPGRIDPDVATGGTPPLQRWRCIGARPSSFAMALGWLGNLSACHAVVIGLARPTASSLSSSSVSVADASRPRPFGGPVIASGFTWFNVIPAIDKDVIGERSRFASHHDYNVTILFASAMHGVHLRDRCSLVVGRMAIQNAIARPGSTGSRRTIRLRPRTVVELFGTFIRNMMADCMPRHEVKHYSAVHRVRCSCTSCSATCRARPGPRTAHRQHQRQRRAWRSPASWCSCGSACPAMRADSSST